MKVLVFAHRLEVGGTQVNAIELSAALRDLHGHDVALFATPGPMVDFAREKGLRFHPAPDAGSHPSMARMRSLREVVRREKPDVLHAWDWPQCLDAYYASHLLQQVPMVVTDMSMVTSRLLPKRLPTTFGTPQLVDQARTAGRRPVELLVPPVDVHANAPGVVDPTPFRRAYGIEDSDIAIVTVSRLTEWMKAESLRRTVDAVRILGKDLPVRFVIVGDGSSRGRLEKLADQTNSELGRKAVVLTGALIDPRPAYAGADVVVGMGGSGLRAMAFAKPLVIVGERCFSAPFNADSAEGFYYKGIYGLGDGNAQSTRLLDDLRAVVTQPGHFNELGALGRQFVVERFSLEAVAAQLSAVLQVTASARPGLHVTATDGLRTAAILIGRRYVPEVLRRRLAAGSS